MSQVMLQLENFDGAYQQSLSALEEAKLLDFSGLIARSQHVLGNVFALQHQFEQASQHYERALNVSSQAWYAFGICTAFTALRSYIIESRLISSKRNQIGFGYLQEARQIFKDCMAELDLREVEFEISKYKVNILLLKYLK